MERIALTSLDEKEVLAKTLDAIRQIEFSTFSVGITSAKLDEKIVLRKSVESHIANFSKAKPVADGFELYVLINLDRGFIEATPSPVYFEGFYNKFSRDVAQTSHYCFICKGRGCKNCGFKGKLTELSVQELIEKAALPFFGSKESLFHGCGREDVDVLMLGKGRPFVVEFVEPVRRVVDLEKIASEINSSAQGKIKVHSLKFCSKGRVVQVKNTEFKKIYRAKCFCEDGVSTAELSRICKKQFAILQRTPRRVEKRRADKEREKSAEILKSEPLSKNEFSVEILSSHGLYIKEFISGDDGRTNPNISSILGKECICVELDVLEIVL